MFSGKMKFLTIRRLRFEQNLGWIIVDCDKLRPPLYPQTLLSTPAPFPFFGDARNEIMIRSLN